MAAARTYLELIPRRTNQGVLRLHEVTLTIDLHKQQIEDGDPRPELGGWVADLEFFRDEIEEHFADRGVTPSGDLELIHDTYFNGWLAGQLGPKIAGPMRDFLAGPAVSAELAEFFFTEGYFGMLSVFGSEMNPAFASRVPLIHSGFGGDWLYRVDPSVALV